MFYYNEMKVTFQTFGCKVNLVETENLKTKAISEGFVYVDSLEDADVIIVNSCAVTDNAEKKSEQYLKKIKKKYPDKKIALTGCMAELRKKSSNADFIITNSGKADIFQHIIDNKNHLEPISNLDHYTESFNGGIIDKTRGFLKIQDGCDNYCSYCIIPFLRGKPRSKSEEKIVDEFYSMLKSGFKEIVLVGIHIGKYGIDTGTSMYDLLKKLTNFEGNFRIRLSSIELNELSEELLDLIIHCDRICKHLHIPLQSASDKVLKLMNRRYQFKDFLEKVNIIKKLSPSMTIGTDLIVGFPGETDEDFEEIYDNIYKSSIDYLHVFPYSEREGTVAAKMTEKIDEKTKSHRSEKLRLLSESKKFNAAKKLFGKEVKVLTEKENKGLTDNYFEVLLNKDLPQNRFITAKIIGITFDGSLIGDIKEEF